MSSTEIKRNGTETFEGINSSTGTPDIQDNQSPPPGGSKDLDSEILKRVCTVSEDSFGTENPSWIEVTIEEDREPLPLPLPNDETTMKINEGKGLPVRDQSWHRKIVTVQFLPISDTERKLQHEAHDATYIRNYKLHSVVLGREG